MRKRILRKRDAEEVRGLPESRQENLTNSPLRDHGARRKQYFSITPDTDSWVANVLYATPFRTKTDAEAVIKFHKLGGASGCQEIYDYSYIFRKLPI
jgi:hypothetical protein